jgi:uridine phosphorylase
MLVCFALTEEARVFRRMAGERPQIKTLITGMGRQNAERAVREYLAGGASVPPSRLVGSPAPPGVVLTCGFAGGLNPELKVGDVVFEIRNSWHVDARQLHVPKSEIRNPLVEAGAKPVTFCCSDRIAITAAEKAELRRKTGADAVEMESEAIHAVCLEQGIRCATVRVISDRADENLPLDFNQLARPDRSLDYGKLAWAIAKSPGKIRALLRLRKQTRGAADKLAQVLVRILLA